MNSIYFICLMTLNRVKLGPAVTFMKYRSLFNISSENFNLEYNHAPVIKFAESCKAGGK